MHELRPITDDEVSAFQQALYMGFGSPREEGSDDRFRRVMPLDRTLASFDSDRIVATLGDFDLQLAVPGGRQFPMGGTTMVTVASTHRRQGLLRALMTEHLRLVAEREDPFAGLWASETRIYGRFGFGMATECHELSFDARLVTLPPAPRGHQIELVPADDVVSVVAPFWSATAGTRPGHIDRIDGRWENIAEKGAKPDGGATATRHIVARRDGEVVGYASYRQTSKWDDAVPNGTVAIEWFMTVDADAHAALWSFLTSIDLFPNVTHGMAPVDDPLLLWVSDPRQVRRRRLDALYLRILDVVAALEGRTYETDGSLVMALTDEMGWADGTFAMEVSGGAATVTPTDTAPDVTMDVKELGSIYLGGVGAAALGRAGRITGSEDALLLTDRLFRTHQPPFCSEDF